MKSSLDEKERISLAFQFLKLTFQLFDLPQRAREELGREMETQELPLPWTKVKVVARPATCLGNTYWKWTSLSKSWRKSWEKSWNFPRLNPKATRKFKQRKISIQPSIALVPNLSATLKGLIKRL